MKNPKVTVLMSVYNGEKYLREAVDSILNQTFKDFEFLIINDGSTDKTLDILQSYKDPRIRIVNNKKNIGLTKSLNKGLKIAKGEYIARMDADDVSLPKRLQFQVNLMNKNKDTVLCGTNTLSINETGEKISGPWWQDSLLPMEWQILLSNPIAHPTAMIRKNFIINQFQPIYRTIVNAEDYDLWCRLVLRGKIERLNKVLLFYRLRKDSESHRNIGQAKKDSRESLNTLIEKISGRKTPKIHFVLTSFCQKKSKRELSIYKIYKWLHFLKNKAGKRWQWNRFTFQLVSRDINMKIVKYIFSSPFNKKCRLIWELLMLRKCNILMILLKSKVYKVFKRTYRLINFKKGKCAFLL